MAFERKLKILDSENATLEGELDGTREQVLALHDEVDQLVQKVESLEGANVDLTLARDEALRRGDRLAESNRSLMLSIEDLRAEVNTLEVNS